MNHLESTIQSAFQSVEQVFENYEKIDFSNVHHYADWLAQTHHYVHHVTRALAFAISKCDLYQEKELHFRIIDHLNEERGHDLMLINDIKNLGIDIKDYPEKIETRNFYQTSFYMIETYGPYALLGYSIPLEGLACKKLPPTYLKLKSLYGESCCTFLKEHCEVDIKHFGEAIEFLNEIAPSKLSAIQIAIHRSTELYSQIMDAIGRESTVWDKNYSNWNYSRIQPEITQ